MQMYKNHRKFIATVSLGEARILQDPDSDVSLQIPQGSKGVFMTHVQMGPSKTLGCMHEGKNQLISPTVEVHHQKLQKENNSKVHTINIPHCIHNSNLWKYVQVFKMNPYKQEQVKKIPPQHERKDQDEYYTIDKDVIRINTRRFSEFTCILCCETTCQASIMAFMFGKLEDILESKLTTVKMEAFMCSDLYGIRDFKNVS